MGQVCSIGQGKQDSARREEPEEDADGGLGGCRDPALPQKAGDSGMVNCPTLPVPPFLTLKSTFPPVILLDLPSSAVNLAEAEPSAPGICESLILGAALHTVTAL